MMVMIIIMGHECERESYGMDTERGRRLRYVAHIHEAAQ
jgi:hypothetical protein